MRRASYRPGLVTKRGGEVGLGVVLDGRMNAPRLRPPENLRFRRPKRAKFATQIARKT